MTEIVRPDHRCMMTACEEYQGLVEFLAKLKKDLSTGQIFGNHCELQVKRRQYVIALQTKEALLEEIKQYESDGPGVPYLHW